MNNEIIFYSTPDGDKKIEVLFQEENFWLTQKAIARLFDVEVPAISKHLGNIYETGELERKATLSILETVRREGSRNVKRKLEYFNLAPGITEKQLEIATLDWLSGLGFDTLLPKLLSGELRVKDEERFGEVH